MKPITIVLILFSFLNSKAQEITKYEGEININSLKKVKANFKILFENEDNSDSLHLFINKNAEIKNIYLNNSLVKYSVQKVENDLPDIKKISIKKDLPKSFNINLIYNYPLTSIENKTFQYNPHWIELNNFTGWFPFNRENSSYNYTLNIQIPKNYKLKSPGRITKKQDHWIIENYKLNDDIPVIISDRFEIFQSKNKKVDFYTTQLNSRQKRAILEDGNEIINFFENNFGSSNQSELLIAINPFSHPWSYTRKGFISLSLKNEYKFNDRLRLAHEIAHLWWSNNKVYGNGNDWLNEAFSEYSSLIWYKQHSTKNEFDNLLEKYRNAFDLNLKITEVKPGDNKFIEITYFKGAYLLYDLNRKIGDKKMQEILEEINRKKINKNSEFLQILNQKLNSKIVSEIRNNIL